MFHASAHGLSYFVDMTPDLVWTVTASLTSKDGAHELSSSHVGSRFCFSVFVFVNCISVIYDTGWNPSFHDRSQRWSRFYMLPNRPFTCYSLMSVKKAKLPAVFIMQLTSHCKTYHSAEDASNCQLPHLNLKWSTFLSPRARTLDLLHGSESNNALIGCH